MNGRVLLDKRFSILLIGLLFVLFLILRLIHLPADPPVDLSWSGGLFGDEGGYAHNARNKVLFGIWVTDDLNPIFYNPILTFVTYLTFKAFGVGLIQLRLINVITSFLGLVLIFLILKKSAGKTIALIATFFLGFNYVFLMYSRLGLNDTFLTFFLILTLFFLHRGLEKDLYLFLTGIFSFAVYVCKASAAYFIFVVAISLLFALFQKSPEINKRRIIRSLSLFLCGLMAASLVWFVFYFWPHRSIITSYGSNWARLSLPENVHQLFSNLRSPYLFKYFSSTPVVLLICCLYLPFLIYFLIAGWKKVHFIEFFALIWLAGGYICINGLNYRPLRYFISLLPPMCILSSFALSRLSGLFQTPVKKKGKFLFIPLTLLWALFITKLAVDYIGISTLINTFIKLILAFLAISALLYIIQDVFMESKVLSLQKNKIKLVNKRTYVFTLVVSIIFLSLITNGRLYWRWARSPHFTVIDTSRELGNILDDAYIVGLWAPLICLENQHKALYVGKGRFNDKDTFKRYSITHLFLWDGNHREELRFLQEAYPQIVEKAKLIKIYNIKGLPTRLFQLKKIDEN